MAVWFRIRPRKMISYPNDLALDLLLEGRFGAGKSVRHLATIRRSRIGDEDSRRGFWRRVSERMGEIGLPWPDASKVAAVVPPPEGEGAGSCMAVKTK